MYTIGGWNIEYIKSILRIEGRRAEIKFSFDLSLQYIKMIRSKNSGKPVVNV